MVYAEPIRGKDSIFYLTIHFSRAGIYGIHGSQVKFRTISSQEKLMHKALKINIKKQDNLSAKTHTCFLKKVVRVFWKGRTCFPESFHRKQ